MRRFLVTSPAFSGQAELLYRADGYFVKMDLTQTNMPAHIIQKFKDRVPAHVNDLKTAYNGTSVDILESDFEVTFDMFWQAYDHKINRKRAEPIWNKLSKSKQVKAYFGVIAYDKYLRGTGFRKKADPDTYLRNEYFESEWKQ